MTLREIAAQLERIEERMPYTDSVRAKLEDLRIRIERHVLLTEGKL